jgi:hypothetical protein
LFGLLSFAILRWKGLEVTRVRKGRQRPTVLLCRSGWQINHERICRLYKQVGLRVPKKIFA